MALRMRRVVERSDASQVEPSFTLARPAGMADQVGGSVAISSSSRRAQTSPGTSSSRRVRIVLPQAGCDARPSAVLSMIFPVALRSATKRSDHQVAALPGHAEQRRIGVDESGCYTASTPRPPAID